MLQGEKYSYAESPVTTWNDAASLTMMLMSNWLAVVIRPCRKHWPVPAS